MELYDLAHDPDEKADIASSQPGRTKSPRAKLDASRKDAGAQVPTPNPDYDAAKDAQPRSKAKG